MKMAEWLLPLKLLTIDDQFRFWDKVDRKGADECWLWTASLYDKRYGRFTYQNGSYSAHRVSYFLHSGKDPGELLVLHECNNTRCVNPKHLFLGDNSVNQQHRVDSGNHHQEGELNPGAKLRECDVREIRILIPIIGRAACAKKFDVTISTIHQIARGETWRHV